MYKNKTVYIHLHKVLFKRNIGGKKDAFTVLYMYDNYLCLKRDGITQIHKERTFDVWDSYLLCYS